MGVGRTLSNVQPTPTYRPRPQLSNVQPTPTYRPRPQLSNVQPSPRTGGPLFNLCPRTLLNVQPTPTYRPRPQCAFPPLLVGVEMHIGKLVGVGMHIGVGGGMWA